MTAKADAKNSFPPPVFVLAAPRSFSSLVNAMIGQHPQLYGLPELNLFQCDTIEEFNTRGKASGGHMAKVWASLRQGLLRAIAQIYAGEQSADTVRMAERWLRVREDRTTTEVFQEICAEVAPLRVVEKSPGVMRKLDFMERMLAAFPDAKFIHLVRNPLSQCESMLNAKGGVGVLMALNSIDYRGDIAELEPQIAWHDVQIRALKFLDKLPDDQFITIKGEEFLSDLNESMPALCRWLEIDDSPDAIAAMRRPEDSPYSCIGPANARLGNDVNFLKNPKLREGNVRSPDLDTPLSWRKDGQKLHPDVKSLAVALGY